MVLLVIMVEVVEYDYLILLVEVQFTMQVDDDERHTLTQLLIILEFDEMDDDELVVQVTLLLEMELQILDEEQVEQVIIEVLEEQDEVV